MAQPATSPTHLDDPAQPNVRPVPEGRKNLRAGQLMLYPSDGNVTAALRAIPAGQSRTVKELRAALATAHGADITCPVTTGIALRSVAEAAYAAFAAGMPLEDVAPVWRVLDARSPALKKVSFDPAFILAQRAREGLA